MKSLQRQRGVVLFFALILLVVMTFIGVALALNSGQSLRMAGAGSERVDAKAVADGGLAAVLNGMSGGNLATLMQRTERSLFNGAQVLTPLPLVDDGAGGLKVLPQNVSCKRSANASDTTLIRCRRVEVSSSVVYGRDNLGQLTVTEGVEQQVLNGSGS
ncbi:pilus assembly PilX N-terminal domain-containing protein [Shewanella sp. C32]|uniref:Pilus assembly PilX N-terminal domain-containing protein n=1 Tax=Shewanella electrica TaxID=515560 RepID=A0ABT2FG39_9GAMM|nr:pilus assembly PilX N-terminal domain-containing protein [Shewanella electrica]MCH1925444.1 pilus assembly PilX N-terminal domain-containing protein [Shewanella electrica]MCS4555269.1 pilus assembly PilX N-terminal domain-containing protein [Shewanella electrica]